MYKGKSRSRWPCSLRRRFAAGRLLQSRVRILHRIVKSTEGAIIWNWTRTRISAILRVHQSAIPEEWTIRPMYKLWPAKRQTAITWIIAQLIRYRMQTQRRQSFSNGLYRLHAQSKVEMLQSDPKSTQSRQIPRCVVKFL
jgi:hypothetical protein